MPASIRSLPSAARLVELTLALALLLAMTPRAEAGGLVRDPDIEHALSRLAQPVLSAAGLNPNRVQVLVYEDPKFNAFVASPSLIVVHSGMILRLERAEQLQAVLAHEAAHIANGHIARRMANMRAMRGVAAVGAILSVAVAATSGVPEAGGGLLMGTQSSAQRLFFAHTRAEEAAADQSGVRYMIAKGIDPAAAAEVLKIFRGQEMLTEARQDPYVRTHPLTRDRIRAVEGLAAAYAERARDDPEADYWFARARAKLAAFTRNPARLLRQTPARDDSDIALMTRAIALHRSADAEAAMREMGRLRARRPQDPFIAELEGQILLESRRFPAAVNAYRRAVQLAPGNALILAGYGRALLAMGDSQNIRRAAQVLESARARDPFDARLLRDLAVAHARLGQNGLASAATAERYALLGDFKTAVIHAKRALDQLPRGSGGWNRAQNVLDAARAAARRK
ncbi:Putative Zn-dependent protease, contains TPR repeats [Meinhardsimonia xiamenensis]|jgi:predicted Zn-dependent protease|uniref:Putative Zn-dependent protease, contains TPR repeats n=1 Tax=Meinhardsimonia xiamenensis TaxID=990712 RepID=A0A1G9CZI2_9RHOB|nr:M48 family metalloprotease [Meinhardsimonia xiamenensis]PRX38186.1 putative Zn-dependent protease [Meinhardsimonia xiamenensis]SDK57070.1 Putative Zn-dependent protease, contains TPR repeats [Meinhardsimonia xiamenensis]